MESLYLLIPLSVLLVFLIGILFWWSLRSGQFDDLEGPGYRVLMDNDKPVAKHGEVPGENVRNTPEMANDQACSAVENEQTNTSR